MIRLSPSANPLASSLYEVERLIACVPTWQTLLGTTDWTEARDRIAFVEDDADPLTFPRPTCVITANQPVAYHQVGFGVGNFLRPTSEYWVYLALDVPDEYRLTAGSAAADQQPLRKNQFQYMANLLGQFVDDIAGLAGTDQTVDSIHAASHPSIPSMRILDMARNPETTWASMGQFWYLVLSLQIGDGN